MTRQTTPSKTVAHPKLRLTTPPAKSTTLFRFRFRTAPPATCRWFVCSDCASVRRNRKYFEQFSENQLLEKYRKKKNEKHVVLESYRDSIFALLRLRWMTVFLRSRVVKAAAAENIRYRHVLTYRYFLSSNKDVRRVFTDYTNERCYKFLFLFFEIPFFPRKQLSSTQKFSGSKRQSCKVFE